MHSKTTAAFAAALAGLCLPIAAADIPVPGFIYPSSLQVGTTTRVIVGGNSMRGVNGAIFTGEGVRVTRVVQVPGFPRASGKTEVPWAREWFYDILAGDRSDRELPPEAVASDTDWYHCDWWEHLNQHDDLELQIICRFWLTPENYPQPTPALDQQVILDVEVDANAKTGCRELMVYNSSSISAPHPFFITKEPHIAEPFLVIPQGEDRKVRLPHVLHLPCNLPVQKPPVVMDGQAWPGEVDVFRLQLTKGVRYTFDMVARELLPYLGDAVPGFFNPVMQLFDPNGKEVGFEDGFHYLPDPILSCIAPVDGVYTLKIYDNLYRGRQDFVYTVRCFEDSPNGHSYTPQKRAFVCYPPPASHLPPQSGDGIELKTGTIDCPGRVIRHTFKVDEPSTLEFELFARRNGSPLDGRLRLYGPITPSTPPQTAPLLAQWDDLDKFLAGTIAQAICDPRGSWTFLNPGEYCIAVSDQEGNGGEDFSYTLAIGKRQPDFEIYSVNSSALLSGDDATLSIKVIPLNGFTGQIHIEGNDDFECDYVVYSDTKDPQPVTIKSKRTDWKGLKLTQFFASAEIGPKGKRITRRITPTDSAEQAFAYTHLVPQRAFFIYKP